MTEEEQRDEIKAKMAVHYAMTYARVEYPDLYPEGVEVPEEIIDRFLKVGIFTVVNVLAALEQEKDRLQEEVYESVIRDYGIEPIEKAPIKIWKIKK